MKLLSLEKSNVLPPSLDQGNRTAVVAWFPNHATSVNRRLPFLGGNLDSDRTAEGREAVGRFFGGFGRPAPNRAEHIVARGGVLNR